MIRYSTKMTNFIVVTIICIGFGLTDLHANSLERAIELHDAAEEGDGKARNSAVELLEKLKVQQPQNAKVIGYLGSIYGIVARDGWNPLKKGEFANKSLKYIDIAVEMDPDDIDIRMIRSQVQKGVPFFYGRKESAIEDMVVLDRMFRANPTKEIARNMPEIYEYLVKEAPDRGNWQAGITLAKRYNQ